MEDRDKGIRGKGILHWVPPPNSEDKCEIPPTGWTCTREAGHDGPCAALPANDLMSELRFSLRSAQFMKERARVEPKVITHSVDWWEGKITGLQDAIQMVEDAGLAG